MADQDNPQIYLVTPSAFELSRLTKSVGQILDEFPIACLRLDMASDEEDEIARAADSLRELSHAKDIPVVISNHIQLVERLGLDGVHLNDGAKSVRSTRKSIGADPIVGSFCGTSRHDAMNAGEAGADYVVLGPITASTLGDGNTASFEDFEWWSQMIELPIVAEGNLSIETIETLAPVTDFFAIGNEIWREDSPSLALKELLSPLS